MWSCGGDQTHSCRLNSVGLSFLFDGMQGPEAMDAVSVYDAALQGPENVGLNQLKNNGYANDLPPVTPAPSATSGSGSEIHQCQVLHEVMRLMEDLILRASARARAAPAPSSVVGVLAPSTSDDTEFEMLASLYLDVNEKASESFLNDIRFRENANISIAIASALRASCGCTSSGVHIG